MGLFLVGCGKGWRMDYGKPAAQFLAKDVAAKGNEYVGKKITVKGTLEIGEELIDKESWIVLEHGIRCNLGNAIAMGLHLGEVLYIDGFLTQCESNNIVLQPAMMRDPAAPFYPIQAAD